MTRKVFALSLLFSAKFISAQNDIDAMRYSQTTFFGDARFMSMAGSFGALGANLSCMNYNPAGIAMYRNGEFVFTPGVKVQSVDATHYGTSSSDISGKVNISNIGFVTAWDQRNPTPPMSKQYSKWNQRNAFGISYNRMADFNYQTSISGNAANSSIMNDFANAAQGLTPDQMNQFYEGLAWNGYLINPGSAVNSYVPNINSSSYNFSQQKTISSSGRMGELAFAFAHAFNDKLYLGATVGVPLVKYNYQGIYSEFNPDSSKAQFRSLKYEEDLATSGVGINLKLGVIYRINTNLRVGGYVHTPTRLNLTDNYQNTLNTTFYRGQDSVGNTSFSNQSPTGTYNYKITTPGRIGGSICYIFQKLLAVNVDAEYVNYASAKLSDSQNSFSAINLAIQNKYSGTTNIRIGAELNIRPVVFRAGFASYGSPFGDVIASKFVRNSITGGVGFRGPHNVYLDLGLAYTFWNENYYLFNPAYVAATQISNSVFYFTATLGVKFK